MKVVKIDPRGKYILQIPDDEDAAEISKTIQDWWNDPNSPVIIGPLKFKIIKVGGKRWLSTLLTTLRLKRS